MAGAGEDNNSSSSGVSHHRHSLWLEKKIVWLISNKGKLIKLGIGLRGPQYIVSISASNYKRPVPAGICW